MYISALSMRYNHKRCKHAYAHNSVYHHTHTQTHILVVVVTDSSSHIRIWREDLFVCLFHSLSQGKSTVAQQDRTTVTGVP